MKLGALNLTLQHLIEHSFGCDFEMKHEQNILVLEADCRLHFLTLLDNH
jgi:hypothetical protein